jgi:hypothetical protein
MTALSEALTIGLVLVLLFGSICLYLYTRIQQNEQKLNLVENILIDLKMTTEVKNYPDLPAPVAPVSSFVVEMSGGSGGGGSPVEVVPTDIEVVEAPAASGAPAAVEESYKNAIQEALESVSIEVVPAAQGASSSDSASVKVGANYPSMTLSELKALAKQRGISGASGMKRQQLIEALQTSDRAEESGAPAPLQPFPNGELTVE